MAMIPKTLFLAEAFYRYGVRIFRDHESGLAGYPGGYQYYAARFAVHEHPHRRLRPFKLCSAHICCLLATNPQVTATRPLKSPDREPSQVAAGAPAVPELRVRELALLRVGGEGGEPVTVDVGEPQLRSRGGASPCGR